MTDNEIIKALECCKMPVGSGACNSCHLKGTRNNATIGSKSCTTILIEKVLDLITRQNAEIEKLNYENLKMIASIKNLKADAVKEFVERLDDTKFKIGNDYVIYADNVQTIKKEMVGDV